MQPGHVSTSSARSRRIEAIDMSAHASNRISIGSYSFDPADRILSRNGDSVRLPRKASELLALLLVERGALVSRDRILATIWPEGFVHEGNLTQTIYLVRKAFTADRAVMIENVPRRGYRLRVKQDGAVRGPRGARALRAGAIAAAVIFFFGFGLHLGSLGSRDLSLKAREDADLALYHFDRFENLRLARLHFERVTKEAPGSPEGYAGLALVNAIDGFDSPQRSRYCAQGRAAATRADAAGLSSLGHVANALLHVTCDRSLRDAQRELDAAIALDPTDATALTMRSRVALWRDQSRDAVAFGLRAVANDPVSPEALLALGLAYYYGRDFRDARDTFGRLLEVMPGHAAGLAYLERSDEGLGDFAAADKTVRSGQHDPRNAGWVGAARARILALTGHRVAALAMLRRLTFTSNLEQVAAAYAAAGDDRAAIANFRVAISRHTLSYQVSWLGDFRFAALRRKYPILTPEFVTWR
jgi:DNA-binding winged helix-turn-helix (wHTH) protein/tetratricopeptide (TPR) repeat protein